MRFNRHSDIEGRHAFLSPSNYHWLNYDSQKLEARYYTVMAAKKGTDLHDLAHRAIKLGIKLSEEHEALSAYVSDGIDYGMTCELALYYSDNCFGHADNLCFDGNLLRIHDLKTGITATSFKQLEVYAAIFCLEYSIDPRDIDIELRIYQRSEVNIHEANAHHILTIMKKIVEFDAQIEAIKEGLWD